MFVILLAVPFVLASCSNDDELPKPDSVTISFDDLNGDYTGKASISQGTVNGETAVAFSAKKNLISYSEFPMKEIVYAVIPDPAKANQALTAIGKIKYDLDYTAVLYQYKKEIELNLLPKELTVQVPVDGVSKKVVITFTASKKGLFTKQNTQNMNFELLAGKITVEGTAVNPFNPIKYNFQMLKK
jgi:hypothetical protein